MHQTRTANTMKTNGRTDGQREVVRKRERKALMKSLTVAQMSTASMGKFDKKVNKHEPDAPKSLKTKGKSGNPHLNHLESKMGKGTVEKERNMKIFD